MFLKPKLWVGFLISLFEGTVSYNLKYQLSFKGQITTEEVLAKKKRQQRKPCGKEVKLASL